MVDGKVVGVTTGGNFGYSVGKAIGYGYLPVELGGARRGGDRGLRQGQPGEDRAPRRPTIRTICG